MVIHEVIDEIENSLYDKFGVQAVIHMDPVEVNNVVVHETRQMVVSTITHLYECATIHDFRMVSGENRTNLIFDVVIPYDITDSEDEIISNICYAISKVNSKYFCVIKIDRPFV